MNGDQVEYNVQCVNEDCVAEALKNRLIDTKTLVAMFQNAGFKVHPVTLRRRLQAAGIKPKRFGRQTYWVKADIVKFVVS